MLILLLLLLLLGLNLRLVLMAMVAPTLQAQCLLRRHQVPLHNNVCRGFNHMAISRQDAEAFCINR